MLQTVVDLDALKCADIMTKSPICITPDASLGKAVEVMENRTSKISVLPVVDENGVFLGLLRLHDIYQPQ
jgi:arabinose-5-phosphate isomerase